MTTLSNIVIGGVVAGGVYSLVALGYVVVFRATGVFNFMQPELMLVGALLFYVLREPGLGGFLVALVLACAATAAIGALVYLIVMARIAATPHWIQMIATMGLSIMAINIAQLIWGSEPRFIRLPVDGDVAWTLPGGGSLAATDLTVVLASFALGGLLAWLMVRSRLGVQLSAAAENPRLAAYSGVALPVVFAVAWGIAAMCATVGGVLYASRGILDPGLVEIGLVAFPAAMIGGMDSVPGALLGGLILGLLQSVGNTLWDADVATPLAFVAVFAILLIRPAGLFGSTAAARV